MAYFASLGRVARSEQLEGSQLLSARLFERSEFRSRTKSRVPVRSQTVRGGCLSAVRVSPISFATAYFLGRYRMGRVSQSSLILGRDRIGSFLAPANRRSRVSAKADSCESVCARRGSKEMNIKKVRKRNE